MSLLKDSHPEIYSMILTDEPYDFDLTKLSTMSAKKVRIQCHQGHIRTTSVSHIVRGRKCRQCTYPESNSTVKEKHSYLAEYLKDTSLTNELLSEKVQSKNSYTFVCPITLKEHTTQVRYAVHSIQPGKIFGDKNVQNYVTLPDEYKVDGIEYPSMLPRFSKRSFQWKCPQGHSWTAQAKNLLSLNRFCPYCENRELLSGHNDLLSFSPSIQSWMPHDDPSQILMKQEHKHKLTCIKCQKEFIFKFQRTNDKKDPKCTHCGYNKRYVSLEDLSPLAYKWYSDENRDSKDEINPSISEKRLFQCDQGHKFWKRLDVIKHRQGSINCPTCKKSGGEKWLQHLLETHYDKKVIYNYRKLLDGQEVDVYLPDINLAIEFNGLYWHSESQGKDKYYHYNKWKTCHDQGIRLITVWEDDFYNKKDILEKVILYKIGVSKSNKVPARKTHVEEISYSLASEFLNANHIQGSVSGSIYLGLYDQDGLVAVSVWLRKKDKELYLSRYATSCIVQGGLGKLLKHVIREYSDDIETLTTFSDNAISNGDVYERLGFINTKNLDPDYCYCYNEKRVHKFQFRKKNFAVNHDLKFMDGLTESELASLNNLPRLWDCGKRKWTFFLNQ